MSKVKLSLAILSLCMASHVYARPQTINVCLHVHKDIVYGKFYASFISSDVYDKERHTSMIYQGNSCISHTYQHGPKNIKMAVIAGRDEINPELRLDQSCKDLYLTSPRSAHTDYLGTASSNITWHYTITKVEPYVNVFNLRCSRIER